MPLKLIDRYTRDQIMVDPNSLYVFGDNMIRDGYGGQAHAARNCTNVVGIPTLWAPGRPFTDADADNPLIQIRIAVGFSEMLCHLGEGRMVYWPKDGVGTGIANLKENAPRVWDFIQDAFNDLWEEFGE